MSISFRAVFTHATNSPPNNFLVTEGYFIYDPKTFLYSPTAKVIETTRPDDLPGGTWVFSYLRRETNPTTDDRVAYWTWTQDAPEAELPSPIIRANLGKGVDVGNAVSRAVRGKNQRRALQLLERQRRLLIDALVAAK